MNDFQKLERANAQIDIWIDEEEYTQVEEACKVNDSCQETLKKVFKNPNCTNRKDSIWFEALSSEEYPIQSLTIPNIGNIHLNND